MPEPKLITNFPDAIGFTNSMLIAVGDPDTGILYKTTIEFLMTGPQGWQGIVGSDGVQGWQGAQGWQGWQGSQGWQGWQGAQGWQGLDGTQGWQGYQGLTGSQGFQGSIGAQGMGLQGLQGIVGQQGSTVLDGLGITNSLPKFLTPLSFTNSNISDNGTTVRINGLNIDTDSGSNYIGLTGLKDIVFRTNNIERLLIDKSNNTVRIGLPFAATASKSIVLDPDNSKITFFYQGSTSLAFGVDANKGLNAFNNSISDYSAVTGAVGNFDTIRAGYGLPENQYTALKLMGNGYIGIGSTTPSIYLRNGFDVNQNRMIIYSNGATGAPIAILPTDGNLMVGTSSDAGYKLHVNGSVNISGTFSLNGSSGTTGQVMTSGGTGSTTWSSIKNLVVLNRQTSDYILQLGDIGKLVDMDISTANTITVPTNTDVAFDLGSHIMVSNYGIGQTSIEAAVGVTIRSAANKLKLTSQYSVASLTKIGLNEWYLSGDLSL